MDKFVSVEKANMVFNTKHGSFVALKDINLSIREGEFVTLIGHSGCGKSTLLNLVAGLLQPTSGVLICAGTRDRRAGAGSRRGVPEPFAAAVADLLRERLSRGRARVRRDRNEGAVESAHVEGARTGAARARRATSGRTKFRAA